MLSTGSTAVTHASLSAGGLAGTQERHPQLLIGSFGAIGAENLYSLTGSQVMPRIYFET